MNTYVINVGTGQEEKMKNWFDHYETLNEIQMHLWIPMKTNYVRKSSKIKKSGLRNSKEHQLNIKRTPMFPGYIFLDADSFDAVYKAIKGLKIDSYFNLLGRKDWQIKSVTVDELEFIKRFSGEEVSKATCFGEKVKFIEGPLVGFEGHVRKLDRRMNSVCISVEMFGQKTDVWVAVEMVEKS